MNDKLKDMLNSIPLSDGLDENIKLGFERARKQEDLRKNKVSKTFVAIAASLTIVIGLVSIIGLDKVEAAIKQVLQYVPGYNVLVDKTEGDVLALQEEVSYEKDDTFVKITAASKLDKDLNISVQGNYMPGYNLEVFLRDEEGDIISTRSWSKSSGSKFWQGDYYFEVGGEYKNYTLLLGDLEIPFNLEKTTEVEDFLQLGSSAQDKGISIVAIKKPMEYKLMISLLNQSEGKDVEDYPFKLGIWSNMWSQTLDIEKSMYLIDKEGNKIYPTIPSSYGNLMSDFYFDTIDKEGLKLILPYVKISYSDIKTEKIKIQTPTDGEVQSINKSLYLGKFEINVIDVKRQGDKILISLKSNSLEDEILDYVYVRGVSGYGMGLNEDTGYMELSINQKDAGERFSIYFESPTSLLLGNWEIDLD